MNVTMKEIVELLRAHLPAIRTKQRFVLWRVHSQAGRLIKQEMGSVGVHKRGEAGENKSLEEVGFRIGDLMDVSINYK